MAVREVKEDERRVKVSFSSEQAYSRWFGTEILQHDKESVNLERLISIGVGLYNHNTDIRYVVAKLENIKLDEELKKTYADLVFDDDDDSEKVFRKVQKGFLKGVSVGYIVDVWEDVAAGKKSSNGRFKGPACIATRWTPYEVSIVAVPADDSVGVNRKLDNTDDTSISNYEREKQMELQALCTKFGIDYQACIDKGMTEDQIRSLVLVKQVEVKQEPVKTIDIEAEKKAAALVERQRTVEITALCREFKIDDKKRDEFLSSEKSLEQVKLNVFEQLKEKMQPVSGGSIEPKVTADEADKVRNAASDAILLRAGIQISKPADGSNDFRSMSLERLALDCLSRSGEENLLRLSKEDVFKKALSPDSQFTSIISDSANKTVAMAYNAAATTFEMWTGRGSNPDFKIATRYRLSEAGELEEIKQSGEFKFDELNDASATTKVLTYGKMFGFTRQAMINDDLGILLRAIQAYVMAGKRGINALVYAIVGGNPRVYDNQYLFHSLRGNLAETGSVLSVASLGTARAAMRKQKNLRNKEYLNIQPAFLIVPPDLEVPAYQLLNSISDPAGNNSNVKNPFAGSMQPVVEPELDQYDANAWYLAANPSMIDTIEVTYLNGIDSPIVEQQESFDRLGVNYRIYQDVGVTCVDAKGLYKNEGADPAETE